MIKNYYLYYSYKNNKDTLFIYFDTRDVELNETKHGQVSAMYSNDGALHSYRIHKINDFIKIRNEGFIFDYNEILIKAINFMLENAGFETLCNKRVSRYVIGEVIDITEDNVIVIYNNNKYFDLNKNSGITIKDKVVIALKDAILSNGHIVKDTYIDGKKVNCHICRECDLSISNSEALIDVNEEENNTDFYL